MKTEPLATVATTATQGVRGYLDAAGYVVLPFDTYRRLNWPAGTRLLLESKCGDVVPGVVVQRAGELRVWPALPIEAHLDWRARRQP